jgi:putative MFS transporter
MVGSTLARQSRPARGRAGDRRPGPGGVTFHHPLAFWAGTFAMMFGVLLHLPDFFAAGEMDYGMEGMPMSRTMLVGMAFILGGLAVAAYGVIPRGTGLLRTSSGSAGYRVRAMDDAPLTRAHWGLLFVLGVALIVDVMKPATLGFVVPGMKLEYGLSTLGVATFPLTALTGTTIGSFMWGLLADRIGRRATILLASLIFIGTSICGFMPHFGWNLLMCFIMGLSAGGMLPIVYALMAESVPARKRGWLVVLHGGMGTVGGYLVASGLAALLEPHFGWRILWFAGLPTGALVLLLNRWIPESPRFLLERGRPEEARAVMARYGVLMTDDAVPAPSPNGEVHGPVAPDRPGLGRLFRQPHLPHTLTVGLYGLGWGLVNWGFITFVPVILQDQGVAISSASGFLFLAALISVPGTVLVAYLYGMWSSRKSMILYALLTAASLAGFAVARPTGGAELTLLMVVLLVSSGGVISMLSPYTAEVYPTALRGTGSGLAAGSSKLGGILGPPLVAGLLAVSAGFSVVALVAAIPILASAVVMRLSGVETRDRGLEEITSTPIRRAPELTGRSS